MLGTIRVPLASVTETLTEGEYCPPQQERIVRDHILPVFKPLSTQLMVLQSELEQVTPDRELVAVSARYGRTSQGSRREG